jgi:hypothetical protein
MKRKGRLERERERERENRNSNLKPLIIDGNISRECPSNNFARNSLVATIVSKDSLDFYQEK